MPADSCFPLSLPKPHPQRLSSFLPSHVKAAGPPTSLFWIPLPKTCPVHRLLILSITPSLPHILNLSLTTRGSPHWLLNQSGLSHLKSKSKPRNPAEILHSPEVTRLLLSDGFPTSQPDLSRNHLLWFHHPSSHCPLDGGPPRSWDTSKSPLTPSPHPIHHDIPVMTFSLKLGFLFLSITIITLQSLFFCLENCRSLLRKLPGFSSNLIHSTSLTNDNWDILKTKIWSFHLNPLSPLFPHQENPCLPTASLKRERTFLHPISSALTSLSGLSPTPPLTTPGWNALKFTTVLWITSLPCCDFEQLVCAYPATCPCLWGLASCLPLCPWYCSAQHATWFLNEWNPQWLGMDTDKIIFDPVNQSLSKYQISFYNRQINYLKVVSADIWQRRKGNAIDQR